MARSYTTVGQMVGYALDRLIDARGEDARSTRGETLTAMARHMLDYLLLAPDSRAAFMEQMAKSAQTVGAVSTARPALPGKGEADIRIQLDGEDDAVLLLLLDSGRPLDDKRIARTVPQLGDSPRSMLVTLSKKTGRPGYAGPSAERVIESSWERLAKRMPKADKAHAPLWRALAEIAMADAVPTVQLPVDAATLLRDADLAREMQEQLELFRRACRTLLRTTPRISTQRGQRSMHLRAGMYRGRTGLEFGAVEASTPIHLVRDGERLMPLGVGRPSGQEHARQVAERLAQVRSLNGWRDEGGVLPARAPLAGAPASAALEGARQLLWSVLNPVLLADQGFVPAPARTQPGLTSTALTLRVVSAEQPQGPTYRVQVGGRARWKNLIVRVTREATADLAAESYAVPPAKGQTTADYVAEVHRALFSLTVAVKAEQAAAQKSSAKADVNEGA